MSEHVDHDHRAEPIIRLQHWLGKKAGPQAKTTVLTFGSAQCRDPRRMGRSDSGGGDDAIRAPTLLLGLTPRKLGSGWDIDDYIAGRISRMTRGEPELCTKAVLVGLYL